MKCKDCESFKIIQDPIYCNGIPFDAGRAECKKYNLFVDFLRNGKLNKLECMEENIIKEKEKIISKFRDIMPKRAWTENKDIYELIDGNLVVYGQNGRFYVFKYTDENDWSITEYPRDIYGVREWHGYGKGWREIDDESTLDNSNM